MKESRFYLCTHCGNLVGLIEDGGAPLMCCGEKMKKLEPGVVEASAEKHLPVVQVQGDLIKVSVGSVAHPMAQEHSIQWIYLATERGGQRKALLPGEAPEACFTLCGDKPLAVFAYCNLHGLWKTDL